MSHGSAGGGGKGGVGGGGDTKHSLDVGEGGLAGVGVLGADILQLVDCGVAILSGVSFPAELVIQLRISDRDFVISWKFHS